MPDPFLNSAGEGADEARVAARRAIEIDLTGEGSRGPLERLELELEAALLAEGLLSRAEFVEARAHQRRAGGRLSTCIYELGLVDEVRLRVLCGRILRVPTALPDDVAAAPPELIQRVGRAFAASARVIPFARSGDVLLVATAEPWRLPLLDSIGARAGCAVEPRFLDERPLAPLLRELLGATVDERFLAEPRRRRRPARLRGRPDEDATEAELISEDDFASLFHERPAPRGERDPRDPRSASGEDAPGDDDVVELVDVLPDFVPEAADTSHLTPLADLAGARRALADSGDRRQLAWALIRFGLSRARRVVLLARRAELWMGWTGAGAGIDPRVVGALMIPPEPGTIFHFVESTGAHFLGPLPSHPIHERFLALLGGAAPRGAALIPVMRRGRAVLGLYLDGGAGGELPPGASEMLVLGSAVGPVLERLARDAKSAPGSARRQARAAGSSRTPGTARGR